jgi:hypothetical protein
MASTQTGDSTADQAKERAQQATAQAKDAAQQAGQQAKSRVSDEVDRRSTMAGEQATTIADAIRQASQQLREQGKDSAARPVEQAAQRVENIGGWLRDKNGDEILHEVESFGRKQPLAIAAGGLAIGFALSRLLKASSTQRYHTTGVEYDRTRQLPVRTSVPPATTTVPDRPYGADAPITTPGGAGSYTGAPPATPGTTGI